MYMLHRAPELFPGASFAVAHCNFCLRGEESDGDEAFVRKACEELGTECLVRRFDTLGYASRNGVSVEMAARELRYAWFGELCRERGFDALATAHNAGDNAETLILNLLRGTGTKGLRGIPSSGVIAPDGSSGSSLRSSLPLRSACGPLPFKRPRAATDPEPPSGLHDAGVVVVRPLLGTSREEIRKWMEQKGFQWREDRTNAENEARRNKIRNQVFPVFAEINPSFIRTLGEDIQRFRQTDDIAEDYFRSVVGGVLKDGPADGRTVIEINVPALLELKHWRYVLWRVLEDYSFSAPTFEKLCALLERYRTEPSGTVTLSGKSFQSPGYILRARRKTLILCYRQP